MSPLYYVTLFFLWLPISALLSVIACAVVPKLVRAYRKHRRYRQTRLRIACE